MSQRILTVSVDLSHPLVVHPIPGIMGGGDRYADIIRVLVYQNGEPVTLSGTVTGYVMNRAGDTFVIDGVCSGNGVQVQLIEEVYELPGPITIAVRLVNGDVKTTLAICSTAVKMTSTTTVYDPGDIVPDLDDVRARLAEVIAATNAANSAAAFYPMTYAGPVSFPEGKQEYYAIGNWVSGEVIPAKASGANTHYVIELGGLIEGETFTITARDGSTAQPWGIIDKDRRALAWAGTDRVTNRVITVPEGGGGGTLIVQVGNSSISSAKVIRNRNLTSVEERIDHLDDALDQIAVPFDDSTAYVAGQMVYYNDLLYRFTTYHPAGAWTGADAVQIVLGDEVGGVKSDVNDLKSAITYDEYLINNDTYTIKADTLESGQWGYSTKVDNPARARTKNLLPVRAGMEITYANTTFDTYFGVLETPTSQTYIQASGWKTDGNGTISITKDGWLTFIIRNHADTTANVSPADYDSTVVILTESRNKLHELESDLGNNMDLSGIAWLSDSRIESDGQIGQQENDQASDYIPVYPLSKIHIDGVDIRGHRCICGYNKDQVFVPPAIVIGNTTQYPNAASTIDITIPGNVTYIRLTKHTSTTAIELKYISIVDSVYAGIKNAYDDLHDDLYDGRSGIDLMPLGIYSRSTSFDPTTDMPYQTWWYGQYANVKTALADGGSLAGFPETLTDDAYIKISKYCTSSPGGIYIVESPHFVDRAFKAVSGTVTWKKLIDIETMENSGITITADNKSTYFTDANNAPINQWFEITAGAEIANTPYGNGTTSASGVYTNGVRSFAGYLNGMLFTYRTTNGARTAQIFVSAQNATGASDPSVLYYRAKYYAGQWSDWHKVSDKMATSASNIAIRKKMIAPYLDGDGNPTADEQYSSNPNPQYMADDPLIFKDFNDAPLQSVYQIDLDCDATVMANNPKPGVSSVLITTGFSYTLRHGTVQLCVGIKTGETFAYIRYGYQNAVNDYRWTAWTDLTASIDTSTVLINNGRFANGGDINDLTGNSIYMLGTNGNYAHAPSDLTFGFITTKSVGSIIHQTIETSTSIYLRSYDGTNWSEWVKK